jgi:thiol-disulfide isomerase/thioredoxin
MNQLKRSLPVIFFIAAIIILGIAVFIFSSGKAENKKDSEPAKTTAEETQKPVAIPTTAVPELTFKKVDGAEIMKENGKPVIMLFSTTWCPHCKWIKETFDSTVKKYVDAGKIVAYHWEMDTKDNTLTPEAEKEIPQQYIDLSTKFNPDGYVPSYVFAGKYVRVGNGYESEKSLDKEKQEFEKIIEELIAQ